MPLNRLSSTILIVSALVLIGLTAFFTVPGRASDGGPTGSISGTVYEDDGVTPVEGAVIFVNDFDTGRAFGNATTSPAGIYTVSGLHTGDYRVQVNNTSQGFPILYYGGTVAPESAAAVAVVGGSDTGGIDFVLMVGGSISGTVLESDGVTPVAGAQIWAEIAVCCGGGGSTSAGDGTYTIVGLSEGSYRVEASAPGQGFAGEVYSEVSDPEMATQVNVTVGAVTSAIDFTLGAGGTISGTVYAPDGTTPVPDANVWAETYDCCRGGEGTRTAANGTYTIQGLAPGDYRVQVDASEQGMAGEFFDDTTDWSQAARVTVVTGQNTADVNFALPDSGSIAGYVYESDGVTPVVGANVGVERFECCGMGNATSTAADGSYLIVGLEAGDYRVRADAPDQGMAGEFYDDATDWSQASPVAVTAGQSTGSIDFLLAAGGSIAGAVTEEDGVTPVGDAFVHATHYDTGGYVSGAHVAQDGTFVVEGLPPGDYRVEAWVPDETGLAREFFNDTTDWMQAARVTVVGGQTTPNIGFALSAGGSISGTVYGSDGVTPVANADVWADSYNCCGGGNGTRTASDGTYTIAGLVAGDYRVQVHAPDQGFAVEIYDDAANWDAATRVSVTSAQTTAGVDFVLATGGSISGTVYGADGVTPVADADVWADIYDCCGGGNGTRTASDGTYTVQGLAPGDYRVQVRAPGQGFVYQLYDGTTDWSQAAPVTVSSGASTTGIDFSLAAGGAVSGTVYQADGVTPVADADVWAEAYDCCGGGNGTRTASDGTYLIEGLSAGDYRVQVHAPEQGLAAQFYDGTTDRSAAFRVTVTAGQATGSIDFVLQTGGSVSGTVYEADGVTPVANADVWAESYDCCGVGNGTRTASDGTYAIEGLPPGAYRLQVDASDRGLVRQFYDGTTDWGLATVATVTTGQDTPNIDFTLSAGGSISGTVYEADGTTPVANADVWAESYDCCGGGNGTRTASDGTYVIDGLGSGDYRVQVHAAEQGLAGEFYDDVGNWGQANRVSVTAGQTVAGIDFLLSAGGSISGAVYETDGVTPVAGANLWASAFDGSGGYGWAMSNADGSYAIEGLASGSYRVEVEAGGLVRQIYDNTSQWHLATAVGVSEGQDTPGIDFTLGLGGTITGVVLLADGTTPVPRAHISAGSYDGDGSWGWAETASDGTYTLDGLASGDYRVEVHASDQGLAGEFYNDTIDWDAAARVSVTAGQTTSSIDFLLDAGGSIAGTVFLADGVTPVAGADVWADSYECCGAGSGSRTASDGTYTLEGLASGDYRVQVHVPDQGLIHEFYDNTTNWEAAARVIVIAGQTTGSIDFLLDAGGSLSGTVFLADGVTPVAGADVWADSYDCCGGGNGTRTGADGSYSIQGLGPGDYRVQVHAPEAGLTGEFYNETTNWEAATRVAVTTGQTTIGIDFTLDAGGSISGTVSLSDGVTPVVGADVWADSYDCCGGGNGARTGADGTYSIQGLASGDYRVQVHAPDQGLVHQFYDDTIDWDAAARVSVTAGQTTSSIDFLLDAGGSISGTVFLADGVTPVAGADVSADAYDCCGGGNGSRTGADGTYSIQGLASGDYRVQVHAPEHGLAGEFYNGTIDWEAAARVTVTAGQTTSSIDFLLDAGGSLSGTVFLADGVTPVVGADVWADSYDCCGGGNGARTGADGTYSIQGLASGDYRVQVAAPDQGLVHEFYSDTADWEAAARVSVTAGQTTGSIDFLLDAGGSISGTVFLADGVTPVAGADVSADAYDCCGGGNGARTGPDGTYSIQGLAPGDYRVEVHATDQGLVHEFYNDTIDWDASARVSVTAGQTTSSIDFLLDAGGSIAGTVFLADGVTPVAGADVSADAYDCCGGGNDSRTGPDGTYSIQGLAPGDYRVQVDAPDQGLVHEFYSDTADWEAAARVSVTAGQTTGSIDFLLDAGGSISGTVFLADGVTPVAGADVSADAYDCCGGGNGSRTGADGTYSIQGLASGDYRVEVHATDQGLVHEFYNDTADWEAAARVSVTVGQTTTSIDFLLDAGGSISGIVLRASDGSPVAGADVWAESYECCGGNGTRSGPDGTYVIDGLRPGQYRVGSNAPEHGLTSQFYNGTADWSQAASVSVTAGVAMSGIDFSLPSGGSISGTVYEADGVTPIAGAEVWAEANGGAGNGANTSSDGTYTIYGLAPGQYFVETEAAGFALDLYPGTIDFASTTPVTVPAEADTPAIDFTLEPGGSISGVVTEADGVTLIPGVWVFAVPYDWPWPPEDGLFDSPSASDGTYVIGGLPAGAYRVAAFGSDQGFVAELFDGVADPAAASAVNVPAGANTGAIDFSLVVGGSISGTVFAADGVTPIAGVEIIAEDVATGMPMSFAESAPDGTYTLGGLPAGQYRLEAVVFESLGYTGEYYDGAVEPASATSVTVVGTDDTSGINFTLEPASGS